LDCDVLQADGGTRTAAITGSYIALTDAITGLGFDPSGPRFPLRAQCAAISVGVVDGSVAVDLDYFEDSSAEVDMNVVMDSFGEFIEVQGTGEGATFPRNQLITMLDSAEEAIATLFELQRRALDS
jgi:ribonuclease PH